MTLKEAKLEATRKTIPELKQFIGAKLLEAGYNSFFCRNQTFRNFYRARRHNHPRGVLDKEGVNRFFKTDVDFYNPPPKSISTLGRCNEIGQSMFYATNEFETAVLEVRPTVGEFVSVATFEPRDRKGTLPGFRIKPVGLEYLKNISGLKSCINRFEVQKTKKVFKDLDLVLDKLFTEKDDDEITYKITNAISQCMLSDIIDENGNSCSMNGMLYPSIVRNNRSVNILLKPIYAQNFYQVKAVQTFHIIDHSENGILLKLIRNGVPKKQKDHPSERIELIWGDIQEGDDTLVKF